MLSCQGMRVSWYVGDSSVACINHAEMMDDNESGPLSSEKAKYYHIEVAKFFYLENRT